MSLSWDDYLTPGPGYDSRSPLVRTCSRDLDYSLSWMDRLLSDCDLCGARELEDRGVEISNFRAATIAADAAREAAAFGEVACVDAAAAPLGRVIVRFFDLRAARRMRGKVIRVGGLTWHLQFAHPARIADPKNPPNNGTLILFHAPAGVTEQRIRDEFRGCGAIREVRTSAGIHFVEFWDTRDCARAHEAARTRRMFGVKIAAEYSRPGGFRKNPDAFLGERSPAIARAVKKSAPIITKASSPHTAWAADEQAA
jgi:hypothetical protein